MLTWDDSFQYHATKLKCENQHKTKIGEIFKFVNIFNYNYYQRYLRIDTDVQG